MPFLLLASQGIDRNLLHKNNFVCNQTLASCHVARLPSITIRLLGAPYSAGQPGTLGRLPKQQL